MPEIWKQLNYKNQDGNQQCSFMCKMTVKTTNIEEEQEEKQEKKKNIIYFAHRALHTWLIQSMITTCDRMLEKVKQSMPATHYNYQRE